jgi:hypothetical protein
MAFAPARARSAAALLLAIGAMQSLLIAAFRGGHDMNEARYTYLPAFGVCFLTGLTIEGLVRRVPFNWQKLAYAVTAIGIAILAVGQCQSATAGRLLADTTEASCTQAINSYCKLAADAAATAESQGNELRLVDGPLYLPGRFPPGAYLPWRGLVVAYGVGAPGRLKFVTPEEVTRADLDATLRLVATSQEAAATLMKASLYHILPDLFALSWLSSVCQQEGSEVTIPNTFLNYPDYGLGFTISVCEEFAYHRRLPGLRVAVGQLTETENARLAELLTRHNNPFAIRLRHLLNTEGGATTIPAVQPTQ